MRILSVHNRYQQRGGEDVSRESEEGLLRAHGHTVDRLEDSNDRIEALGKWVTSRKAIWSQRGYRRVTEQLQRTSYDVVHVQNFFPLLSPSVHHAAKAAGVPVVQTLRNYRLLCVNGLLFRNGSACELCVGRLPIAGVRHACYRDSTAASGAVATMITVHRWLGTWKRKVDLFITLTDFAKNVLIRGGLDSEKIAVKPNFVTPALQPAASGDYAIYVGRLSDEKGIDTMLDAWKTLPRPYPLKIVGDGPMTPQILAAQRSFPNLDYLGRLPQQETYRLMGEASMLIFPTKCYETFGRVVAEAYAMSTPVIASKIGAVAEIVRDHQTGLHVQPGDARDLAEKVVWLFEHPDVRSTMRTRAQAVYRQHYSAEANYTQLVELYQRAIEEAHSTQS